MRDCREAVVVGHSEEPVQPREAASVMLLRQPADVYMTARPDTLRVAAGFYVFPGGRVDEADRRFAAARPEELQALGHGEGGGHYVAAAVREVFEEVGLLFARDGKGRALWQEEGALLHKGALAAGRDGLLQGTATLGDVLGANGWRVAADRLAYVSRWVTPPAARRRFDTRFFVADATGCVEPAPFAEEVSRGEWIDLQEALRREERGGLPLMRPTRALLHTVAAVGTVDDIMEYYRKADSPRLEVVERNDPEVLRAVLASQGIRPVAVPSPTLLPATETNVYVVASGGEAFIVDAGDGGDEGIRLVEDAWKRAGRPEVKALVLTHDHRDHAAGAPALLRRFDCALAAHAAAVPRIRQRLGLEVDIPLRGGETLTAGRRRLEVIHTPGHASDHVVLYDGEAGIAFTGDHVVGEGSTWVGPPDGDMGDYLRSLELLLTRRINVIAPGHGPLLDGAAGRIRSLIERRLAREAEILALIEEGPRTVEQLFAALYEGAVPPGVADMARRTVEGHLSKLERDGKVRAGVGGDNGQRIYVFVEGSA